MSTAAYSAAMPARSATFGSAPLLEQHRREIEVRVDDREDQRGRADAACRRRCGSRRLQRDVGLRQRRRAFRSAPSSASARAASIAPSRAAYISGVQPPRGNGEFGPPLLRELEHRRVERRVERALTSAPASTSARTASAWFSAAAHISAVSPNQLLARVDVGAAREQQLDRVDAAGARRGHQRPSRPPGSPCSGRRRPSSSASTTVGAAVGRRQRQRRACRSGWRPWRWRRRAAAAAPVSTSSARTAQCSAVVPSASGALTSALLREQRAHGRAIAALDGVDERRAAAAADRGSDQRSADAPRADAARDREPRSTSAITARTRPC